MKLPVWPKDSWQIIDEDGAHVCFVNTTESRDFIVQAINCHEKLTDALAKKFNESCEHILDALYPKLRTENEMLKKDVKYDK